jgi:hypothetical protein
MKKTILLFIVVIFSFFTKKSNAQIDLGGISSKPSVQAAKDTSKKTQQNNQTNKTQAQQQVGNQQPTNQTQNVSKPKFQMDTLQAKNAFNSRLYKSKITNPSALYSEAKERMSEVPMSATSKVISEAVLPYPDLREEDAVFNEFVWEEIDIRQKKNRIFDYKAYKQNGDQRFMAILLRILKEEKDLNGKPAVEIYSADEGGGDNFVTKLEEKELDKIIRGRLDTGKADVNDPNGLRKITYKYGVTPESVIKFRLKEQYIFDKKYGQLFRRIIGIAPVALMPFDGPDPIYLDANGSPVKMQDGTDSTYTPDPAPKALFWISYPQLRKILSKYNAYNPQNDAVAMTWSDVLDMGYFEANIVKSTMDNEDDLTIFEKFPANDDKTRIKRLEYANKIRQKLFDKEQDRWIY